MSTRWGHDMEERAACTKKAQDAYAIGRQAMEKIAALDQALTELRAELEDERGIRIALAKRVTQLERQFVEATEPKPRQTRKAA